MKRGSWLVILLVGVALIAAIVAGRFRVLEPKPSPATTSQVP
jgi:hypothetical protein